MLKGIARALGAVLVSTLCIYFLFRAIPPASPSLLEDIAQLGAALLLAYVIEAVWLVERVRVDDGHEEWLGFLVAIGAAGLLAVTISLLLAQHRAAGHDNALDDLGLAWAAVSLLILGALVVMQPLLAGSFRRVEQADRRGPR